LIIGRHVSKLVTRLKQILQDEVYKVILGLFATIDHQEQCEEIVESSGGW
jgi:hypothetical protein